MRGNVSKIKGDTAVMQAKKYAEIAENSSKFAPYIGENGNWYTLNSKTGNFEDTNAAAKGERGEKGESEIVEIEQVLKIYNNAFAYFEEDGTPLNTEITFTDDTLTEASEIVLEYPSKVHTGFFRVWVNFAGNEKVCTILKQELTEDGEESCNYFQSFAMGSVLYIREKFGEWKKYDFDEFGILKGYEDEADGYCTENGKIKAYKICGPKKNLSASDWEDYIIIACTAHKSVSLGAPLFNVQYKISRDGIFKRQERVKNYVPLEIEWGEWESFAQSSSLEEKISALKEEINEEYAKKTELEDIETALDRIIEIQEGLMN